MEKGPFVAVFHTVLNLSNVILLMQSSWGDLRSGHGGLKIYYIIVQSLLFLMRSEHNSKVGESICLVLCFQTFQREKKAIQIKTTVFNTFG